MKKLIALIAALCLLFVGLVVYLNTATGKEESTAAAAPEETAAAETEAEPESTDTAAETAEEDTAAATLQTLDYEAIYALHDGDEVVLTIDGTDVTWNEFFRWFYYYASTQEYYMQMYSYYGLTMNWTDVADESGATYLDQIAEKAETQLRWVYTIEKNAENAGAELNEDDLAAIEENLQSQIDTYGSEDAFHEALGEAYLTPEYYDRLVELSYLDDHSFASAYGETADLVTDEEALQYLEDNGYISVAHILLLNTDSTTGDTLTDEQLAEVQAQAAAISEELQSIEDPQARLERFWELEAEYNADTGRETYPDGYVFTSGTMVTEFEDASNALAEYEVSDPVETSYGYHIIIRLPQDPDRILCSTDSSSSPMTARQAFADEDYSAKLEVIYDATVLTWKEGCALPDLTAYLKDA